MSMELLVLVSSSSVIHLWSLESYYIPYVEYFVWVWRPYEHTHTQTEEKEQLVRIKNKAIVLYTEIECRNISKSLVSLLFFFTSKCTVIMLNDVDWSTFFEK